MACWNQWTIGPCGCPGGRPCGASICVTGCPSGAALSGATVTIKSGGATVGTCTTASGCCTIAIPAAGNYEVIVSATGYIGYDGTLALTCGGTIAIALQPTGTTATIAFTLTGCCSAALPGATITLSDGQSCTTDSSGSCSFVSGAATLSYTISKPRWQTYTGTYSPGACATTGRAFAIALTPATGYVCGLYGGPSTGSGTPIADPIPTTLHLTDSVYGSCTLTYGTSPSGWSGTIAASSLGDCGCPAGTSFTITYYMGPCVSSGGAVLNIAAHYCTLEDDSGGTIANYCPCDTSAVLAPGQNLDGPFGTISEGFYFSSGGSPFTASTTVPYDFSGTIASETCTSGLEQIAWYPAGGTITVTE